jgi:SAM-dependent methyltransferase
MATNDAGPGVESGSRWVSGTLYEPYVGRWSRLVARQFVMWLARPVSGRWLDVGCGTGAISSAIMALAEPRQVVGIDPSDAFLSHAKEQHPHPRVRFEIGDAMSLPYPDEVFDTVVSGLMLNFVPEPERAVGEMVRVVQAGGTVAAYVWDYSGRMEMMRYFWDAATALDPALGSVDEGLRFPMCQPDPLADLFRDAGLTDVTVRAIDIPTEFQDFDDYWSPFLGGQAPAPRYAMSLDDERRERLREHLRARLPVSPDGSIPLIARAWAVRGAR